jgi:hypothetical protein
LPIDVAPLEGTHVILGQEAQTVWTVALEWMLTPSPNWI